jgi:hypothetical protein
MGHDIVDRSLHEGCRWHMSLKNGRRLARWEDEEPQAVLKMLTSVTL